MNAHKAEASSPAGRHSWSSILSRAVEEVFELMLGVRLESPLEPPPDAGLDVTAMVGLAGQLCGVLMVRCSPKTAQRVADRMLGGVSDRSDADVADAIGEISNMVAGNFKNKIQGLGDGCMLSVPTVISGADYNMHSLGNNQEIRTVLLFDGDPLLVMLEIHR